MFKITIIGIDGELLRCVEQVGKIEYRDVVHHTFTATFDWCNVKIDDCCVRITNLVRRTHLTIAKCEFEEISIT